MPAASLLFRYFSFFPGSRIVNETFSHRSAKAKCYKQRFQELIEHKPLDNTSTSSVLCTPVRKHDLSQWRQRLVLNRLNLRLSIEGNNRRVGFLSAGTPRSPTRLLLRCFSFSFRTERRIVNQGDALCLEALTLFPLSMIMIIIRSQPTRTHAWASSSRITRRFTLLYHAYQLDLYISYNLVDLGRTCNSTAAPASALCPKEASCLVTISQAPGNYTTEATLHSSNRIWRNWAIWVNAIKQKRENSTTSNRSIRPVSLFSPSLRKRRIVRQL